MRAIPDFLARKPLTAFRAARVIIAVTLIVTVAGGFAMWLLNHGEFPDIGTSLWWSLQTVTSVGYGDVVPEDTLGRLIAAVVMLQGIAFLAIIVAAVTAMFIEQARRRRGMGPEAEIAARLQRIEEKLDALERKQG